MLSGNICGDYHVELNDFKDHQPESVQVCHSDALYEGVFASDVEFSIGIVTPVNSTLPLLPPPDASFFARCYVWCTETGELPGSGGGGAVSVQTLKELVRAALNLFIRCTYSAIT
jgi:hypothetical protein